MGSLSASPIVILGTFVADLAFRTARLPGWGETVMAGSFKVGPGGKGSNQAVAAARLGGAVTFVSKLGRDDFAALARRTWAAEGIDARFVFDSETAPTGGAAIFVDPAKGENAIVVYPGAANEITSGELAAARPAIAGAALFMTSLELPVPLVMDALEMARGLGVTTVLNPAPAVPLPDAVFPLCDYLVPNESEAALLSGMSVATAADAERAAQALLARGARTVVLTLGARGALLKTASAAQHVPARAAGPAVDTTGAGDAFCGAFAVALAEGKNALDAVGFGCAAAGLQVTRWGTAPAMPARGEVEALLKQSA